MGEGDVDEVNEEGRGKKGNPFIFWRSGWEQIRVMRGDIRSREVGSQNMDHGAVKIH